MNTRRLLIILSIIAMLLIVGIGFYFLFSASKTVTPPTGTQTGTGSLPSAGNQFNPGSTNTAGGGSTPPSSGTSTAIAKNFGVISTDPILDYFVDPTNTVTAIEPDGKVVQVINGQATTINSITMPNITSASFSYNGAKVLVSFGDPVNPQTSVFDIAAKAWTGLKPGLLSAVWSPSDYRIAYAVSNANGTESFATLDVSKLKPAPVVVDVIHAQDVEVAWVTKTQLLFYTKPSSLVPGSAWLFDLQRLTLATIAAETPGLAMTWSDPAFDRLATTEALELASGVSGHGGSLVLTDQLGNVAQRLNFLTLPSKCSFATATSTVNPSSTPYLFCGVPRDQDTLSVSNLPDAYNQMSLFTSDDIYRIDLQSGAVTTVWSDQAQSLDVSNVKFFNKMLFFINRYDRRLYTISLSA